MAAAVPSRLSATGTLEPTTLEPVEQDPVVVSGTVRCLLERARDGVREGCAEHDPRARYSAAHLAALRAATAVLAVRGRPGPLRSRPRNVWELLPRLAPELAEWAAFFSTLRLRRETVRVEPRAADDLLRDAERFCRVVTTLLGLSWVPVLPDALPASG